MRKWDFEDLLKKECRGLKKYAESKDVDFKAKIEYGYGSDDSIYAYWEVEGDDWYDSGLSGFSHIQNMLIEDAILQIQKGLSRRVRVLINKHEDPEYFLEGVIDEYVGDFASLLRAIDRNEDRPTIILYMPKEG